MQEGIIIRRSDDTEQALGVVEKSSCKPKLLDGDEEPEAEGVSVTS